MPDFQLILDALDKYAEQTGINLKENPFADKIRGCDSPGSILLLLQENVKMFKEYRDQNRKFIDCLSPVVQFVHAFSAILGEAAGLVSREQSFPSLLLFYFTLSPPGSIPTCKTDLRRHRCPLHRACFPGFCTNQPCPPDIHSYQAAEGVSASYDALLELFECVGSFLKRLEIYTKISLSPLMTEIIVKIMVEILSILAQAKKQVKQGRFSECFLTAFIGYYTKLVTEQFAKKLLGDSEIESIMRRLDRLNQDEARMMDAHILEVVYGLMNNMKVVMDGEWSPLVGPEPLTKLLSL